MSENKKKEGVNRRKFLKTSTVVAVGGAVAFSAVSVPLLRIDHNLLRPPGALEEDAFLAACIKCGQCLQVCPPQVIELAGIWQGFGIATPYITPREGGCILCAGLPCVLACPTGALDHHISEGKEAEMGLAVISQPETCLSILGVNDLVFQLEKMKKSADNPRRAEELAQIAISLLKKLTDNEKRELIKAFGLSEDEEQLSNELPAKINQADELNRFLTFVKGTSQAKTGCRICLEECPIAAEQTIRFITKHNKDRGKDEIWPVVQQSCVGCGLCEEKCPTAVASITIVARKKWDGTV